MAGETALLNWLRGRSQERQIREIILEEIRETVQSVDHLIEKQARIHMASFDTKIRDFYQQFDSIEKRLIRIEEMLNEHRERASLTH